MVAIAACIDRVLTGLGNERSRGRGAGGVAELTGRFPLYARRPREVPVLRPQRGSGGRFTCRPRRQGFIRRRRACLKCNRRYTTYEYIEDVLPRVVKRDGRREPFDRRKLRGSIEGVRSARWASRRSTTSWPTSSRACTRRAEKEISSLELGDLSWSTCRSSTRSPTSASPPSMAVQGHRAVHGRGEGADQGRRKEGPPKATRPHPPIRARGS